MYRHDVMPGRACLIVAQEALLRISLRESLPSTPAGPTRGRMARTEDGLQSLLFA